MKKFLSLFILSLCFSSGWAHDAYVDRIFYNLNEEDKTAYVTFQGDNKYSFKNEYTGDVVIPETINVNGTQYQVTSLGEDCFYECAYLTSVTIPNSVTSLGSSCFYQCSRLTSVTIPNSVTSLGDGCFYDCSGLTSITIPNSVTSLGSSCFSSCRSLTSITIPNSVTSVGDYCFNDCTGLTSITIPNSVTSLGERCFAWSGLTSITIPNSVTSLGSRCFSHCSGLESITVEEGNSVYDSRDNCNAIIVTSENQMFVGCKNTIIPNSVTSLGDYSFDGCIGLTSIDIPNTVTSLGESCFAWSGLTSITIPNSITTLNNSCFSGCDSLTSIEIPNTVTSFGISCFSSCIKLTSFTIPNSVELLGNQCFQGCTGLTSVTIPNSVLSMGSNCFRWCTQLPSIAIPNSIRKLESGCFDGCSNLSSIIIPNSVNQVDRTCFNDCDRLRTIYCYPISYYRYTNNQLNFYSDAYVKLYGGPLCNLSLQKATPSTLTLRTSLNNNYVSAPEGENLEITSIRLSCSYNEINSISDNLYEMNELEVDTPYDITLTVWYSDGKGISTYNTFSTLPPDLSILQPKCVSSSCAIVAATTNLNDAVTNAGFQWKKYDAPASLAPNEAYAAIYDGKLEGYLKNLQSAFYYNVRAFYKSGNGTYYYSDWLTFDPSDFSYFEPTVHTYPVTKTTDCTASVRGYALAGTDEIKEQGFEYWEADGGAAAPKLVKTAALVPAEEDIHTVLASGQVMQVVLDGLKPQTTYTYRAFVRTESGTTYGEEQTFTTEVPTGIGNTEVEKPAPTLVGYYDLSGRRLAGKQRGIVIERYSDGTARKVFVK